MNSTKTAKMLGAQNCLQNHIENAGATKLLTVSLLHIQRTHLQSHISKTYCLSFIPVL